MREPFDHAVTRHGPTVLRVCRAVLGPGPDADDAWSETFLAALRAWPDLPADLNTEAWLVRVAGRKAIDVIRSGARRAEPVAELPERGRSDPDPADREVWAAVASSAIDMRDAAAGAARMTSAMRRSAGDRSSRRPSRSTVTSTGVTVAAPR